MSAWICSDKHISSLVDYAYKNGLIPHKTPNVKEATFKILQSENVKSVSFRYPNSTDLPGPIAGPGPYFQGARVLRHSEVMGQVANLSYQSCEHPGWEGSEAKKICARILKHANICCSPLERENNSWAF